MRQVAIQIDKKVYELLRRRAVRERKSIPEVIQEMIKRNITQSDHFHSFSIKDFRFVGVGRSKQGSLKPVSVRDDEPLKGQKKVLQ